MRNSRLFLMMGLVLVASPVFAMSGGGSTPPATGTFEIAGLKGESFRLAPSMIIQTFSQDKPLDVVLDFGGTTGGGSLPKGAVSAGLQFQQVGQSWNFQPIGSGLTVKDATGSTVISGKLTEIVDYSFDNGEVTITAILLGVNDAFLLKEDTFLGDGWVFSIPNHARYFDAVVEVSYATSATSKEELFASFSALRLGTGVSFDVSSLKITFNEVPEPTTALLVLAGAGWLSRRRR